MTAGTASDTLSAPDSLTDPLTGFGNRRKLVEDLTEALLPTASPTLFVLFDLAGYGDYLSLYGQVRADDLLEGLSRRLSKKLADVGTCYRPRRDEFAALLHAPIETAQPLLDAALAALHKRDSDRHTSIASAFGAVLLPDEAEDVTDVMMLADERLALTVRARRSRERREDTR